MMKHRIIAGTIAFILLLFLVFITVDAQEQPPECSHPDIQCAELLETITQVLRKVPAVHFYKGYSAAARLGTISPHRLVFYYTTETYEFPAISLGLIVYQLDDIGYYIFMTRIVNGQQEFQGYLCNESCARIISNKLSENDTRLGEGTIDA